MKPVKYIIETFLFVLVLFQINMLAGYTDDERGRLKNEILSPKETAKTVAAASSLPDSLSISQTENDPMRPAYIDAIYADPYAIPDAYALAETIKNPESLNALAQKEAERIIRTGDTERLMQEMEGNQAILSLLGADL